MEAGEDWRETLTVPFYTGSLSTERQYRDAVGATFGRLTIWTESEDFQEAIIINRKN